MASYNVLTFDLTTARIATVIAQTNGKRVASLTVTALPAGAIAYLRVGGDYADRFTLSVNRVIDFCPAEDRGIFLEYPVGVGALELFLGYEGSETPTPRAGSN